MLGERVSSWKNSGGLHLWGSPRQSQCSTFSPLSRIHHTKTRSSKWIYGLLLFYCHCPGETLQKTYVSRVSAVRCSGSVAQGVSQCRITHSHTCTNDLIRKRWSQRILAIVQVLILPCSFFISFFNPFAEYKGILKTQFAQEVPNI